MRALIRNIVVLGSLTLIGPVPSVLAQDEDHTATVSTAGVTIEVDTEAWRGEPSRFDKVLPVLVRITNDGEVPLRIRHADFALVTESGERVPATPPFDLRATETVVDDRRLDPFDVRYRYPYGFFRFGPYGRLGYIGYPFDDIDRFERVELPTSDMVSGALHEAVVEPGDRVTGFVYFVDDDDHVDLDHAGRVTFQAELVNAETRRPIDTIGIPLLATADRLEIAEPGQS
ncbi:MAG TPA: hypothetical protein VJP59_02825 [Gemmatimonadota bacterium]|nr:hypothetical protein [Gemmatimonadota bacterium]